MKKSILIVAMLGCYAASAQYTEFFDTQMQLRKKKETNQKINRDSIPVLSPGKWKPSTPPVSPKEFMIIQETVRGKLIMQLANGNKVYALPQDNMPCIVPDMNQFTMPNKSNQVRIYRYPGPGAIPNPAIVQGRRVIPGKIYPVQ